MKTPSVLVIDDSPDIHLLLKGRLKSEGLDLHHALDPMEGLAKARALLPDLILLDVDMPTMSGLEVCRELKSDPVTAALPVVFLTATGGATLVQAFDAGAVDYVRKPFDAAELRARVRSALRTKRYQDLLAERAQVDALTGLRNRGFFERRLSEELAEVQVRPTCLVLADVDHFKRFNDQHGHQFGDRVLQGVAEIFMTCVRATDAACRYGGEEFGIILSASDHVAGAAAAARMQERLTTLGAHLPGSLTVTASFGIASTTLADDPGQVSAAWLVAAADAALYRAKQTGRNRICTAESTPPPARSAANVG